MTLRELVWGNATRELVEEWGFRWDDFEAEYQYLSWVDSYDPSYGDYGTPYAEAEEILAAEYIKHRMKHTYIGGGMIQLVSHEFTYTSEPLGNEWGENVLSVYDENGQDVGGIVECMSARNMAKEWANNWLYEQWLKEQAEELKILEPEIGGQG